MTTRICQWTGLDADADVDDDAPIETCSEEAIFTTCIPMSGVVCENHKCRCSKLLTKISHRCFWPPEISEWAAFAKTITSLDVSDSTKEDLLRRLKDCLEMSEKTIPDLQEACARRCDELAKEWRDRASSRNVLSWVANTMTTEDGWAAGAHQCAVAIRTMGAGS